MQQLVIKEILDKYPNTEYCCIGSIRKKKDDEYNGDIDIVVKVVFFEIIYIISIFIPSKQIINIKTKYYEEDYCYSIAFIGFNCFICQ